MQRPTPVPESSRLTELQRVPGTTTSGIQQPGSGIILRATS